MGLFVGKGFVLEFLFYNDCAHSHKREVETVPRDSHLIGSGEQRATIGMGNGFFFVGVGGCTYKIQEI